jgi:hypothetical protein
MKSTHTKFLLMGAFLASIIFIGVGAAPAAKQSGSDRYTPTKAEWLALYANANWRYSWFHQDKFAVSYTTVKTRPNSIIIRCNYTDTVRRQEMNRSIAFARDMLKSEIKNRGWDWVKIEEELFLLKI